MLDLSSPLSTLQVLTLIYALVHDALAILHKCVVNFGKLSLPSVTFSVVTRGCDVLSVSPLPPLTSIELTIIKKFYTLFKREISIDFCFESGKI